MISRACGNPVIWMKNGKESDQLVINYVHKVLVNG